MKYRVKQEEFEAVQWTGDNFESVRKLYPEANLTRNKGTAFVVVYMPGGHDVANIGDWIVKEPVLGRVFVRSDDEFQRLYEPVPGEVAGTPVDPAAPLAEFKGDLQKPWGGIPEPEAETTVRLLALILKLRLGDRDVEERVVLPIINGAMEQIIRRYVCCEPKPKAERSLFGG